jgi:hypothetical protein
LQCNDFDSYWGVDLPRGARFISFEGAEEAGAFSVLAMGLAALAMTPLLPVLWKLILA